MATHSSLFLSANKFKEKESHPSWTGTGQITKEDLDILVARFASNVGVNQYGVEVQISGWPKENSEGPYISMQLEPKYIKDEQQAAPPADDPFAAAGNSEGSIDFPF